jgi:hypothetical protein
LVTWSITDNRIVSLKNTAPAFTNLISQRAVPSAQSPVDAEVEATNESPLPALVIVKGTVTPSDKIIFDVIVTDVIVDGPPASGVYVQVPANVVPRLKITEVDIKRGV